MTVLYTINKGPKDLIVGPVTNASPGERSP